MKRVLLVSASKSFLDRNVTLLSKKGFQFFTSPCGAEALKMHEEQPFDLILSELDLGDMDGCRFCQDVRNIRRPSVPVVIICHDNVEFIERAKQSDASAILLRPINPTHLLITIGSFIDMQLARDKRVAFIAPVLCRAEGEEILCEARDISITGILVETEHYLAVGSTINCQFTLHDNFQIQPEGEINRCFRSSGGKRRYGIKFINLPVSGRRAIERHVVSNNHLGIKQTPYRPLEKSACYQI